MKRIILLAVISLVIGCEPVSSTPCNNIVTCIDWVSKEQVLACEVCDPAEDFMIREIYGEPCQIAASEIPTGHREIWSYCLKAVKDSDTNFHYEVSECWTNCSMQRRFTFLDGRLLEQNDYIVPTEQISQQSRR